MIETRGWLLDLYPDPQGGCTLWLLGDDGRRLRLNQAFPAVFYAAGEASRLQAFGRYITAQPPATQMAYTCRRDLFQAGDGELTVLAVQVEQPVEQPRLFWRAARAFPDLTYYDADLPFSLRHAAVFGSFPLCRCRVSANRAGQVSELEVLDSPWDIEADPPPLRILHIEPDVDPRHAPPTCLQVRFGAQERRLMLQPERSERPMLAALASILNRWDPDLIVSAWGDGWLLPHLLDLSRKWRLPLALNRDPRRSAVEIHPERSYFSYGQIIHRDQQVHLFGRVHVDVHNAMLYHDYGLDGIFELSRVTGLPLQTVARTSPGSGVSAMEMVTALRQGILVPWHKQQAERPKTALELIRADQGGMVYQPIIGLHGSVAELDFVSMYPSIMVHCNISPETVGSSPPRAGTLPDEPPTGLVPQTLAPLLNKRITLKKRLISLPHWDPRRKLYKARASAHKWLLVTSFGYLGYKNARFGRIEAHEAVTTYSREALLRAKEAAEDMGYTVLHLYVDGLWVVRPNQTLTSEAVQPLMDEIEARTGLPIALDGIYKWVAFLPSRQDERIPVANRYFGVFQDGTLKTRGIEARRRDTPAWVAKAQMECLERLAQEPDPQATAAALPEVMQRLRSHLRDLAGGKLAPQELLVAQKLSRELSEYRSPSPAAHAAMQLKQIGKPLRPGQMVRFVHTLGKPGVHAWDLDTPIEFRATGPRPLRPPAAARRCHRPAALRRPPRRTAPLAVLLPGRPPARPSLRGPAAPPRRLPGHVQAASTGGLRTSPPPARSRTNCSLTHACVRNPKTQDTGFLEETRCLNKVLRTWNRHLQLRPRDRVRLSDQLDRHLLQPLPRLWMHQIRQQLRHRRGDVRHAPQVRLHHLPIEKDNVQVHRARRVLVAGPHPAQRLLDAPQNLALQLLLPQLRADQGGHVDEVRPIVTDRAGLPAVRSRQQLHPFRQHLQRPAGVLHRVDIRTKHHVRLVHAEVTPFCRYGARSRPRPSGRNAPLPAFPPACVPLPPRAPPAPTWPGLPPAPQPCGAAPSPRMPESSWPSCGS